MRFPHAFWNRVSYNIMAWLICSVFWLTKGLIMQLLDNHIEVLFRQCFIKEVRKHLSFVGSYVLSVTRIWLVALYRIILEGLPLLDNKHKYRTIQIFR